MKTRLHFVFPSSHTINFRGDYETKVSGSALIGRYGFDATLGAGYSGGIDMTTISASDSIAGTGIIAESNGYIAGPSSC